MNKPVPSTYTILKKRALNEDIDRSWIDWALEMIEADFESDNLYTLAGMTEPYNQFELLELVSTVLQDLQLVFPDNQKVIRNYVYFIVRNAIVNTEDYFATLSELKDIYCALDMDREYQDFFSLYYAKDDLEHSEHQWYWHTATRENIDGIIKEQFQIFIDKFESDKSNVLF